MTKFEEDTLLFVRGEAVWPFLNKDPNWPLNELWPKPIGFLYSMWYTYIPNMRPVQTSLLEISCLQGFYNLTPVDPKWPLTSTKNNRLLELNVVHLHTKYEICPSFPSWDIVFTSGASPHMHAHTHAHAYPRQGLRTRARMHTRTHTHTHACMTAKVTIIIETKKPTQTTLWATKRVAQRNKPKWPYAIVIHLNVCKVYGRSTA